MRMQFFLFSRSCFDLEDPIALIESYCFQSDFFANYDLLLKDCASRSIDAVNEIGARIKRKSLSKCEEIIDGYREIPILSLNLDEFLNLDIETRGSHVEELSQLVKELDVVPGIGLSKATKILHTIRPRIMPMIDRLLQREYGRLKPRWRRGGLAQIFIDYYENFKVGKTYENLCTLHEELSSLTLTKIRIFDILWWSFLKADALSKKARWTTIRRLA